MYGIGEKKRFLTVKEAAEVLQIGKTKAWELVRCGKIPTVSLGKKCKRVPAEAIERLAQRALQSADPGSDSPGAVAAQSCQGAVQGQLAKRTKCRRSVGTGTEEVR